MSFWKRTLNLPSENKAEPDSPSATKGSAVSPSQTHKVIQHPVSPKPAASLGPPPTSPKSYVSSPVPVGRPHPLLSLKRTPVFSPSVSPMPNVFDPNAAKVALSKEQKESLAPPLHQTQGDSQPKKLLMHPVLDHSVDNDEQEEEDQSSPLVSNDKQDEDGVAHDEAPSLTSDHDEDNWGDDEELDDLLDGTEEEHTQEGTHPVTPSETMESRMDDTIDKGFETPATSLRKEMDVSLDETEYFTEEWTTPQEQAMDNPILDQDTDATDVPSSQNELPTSPAQALGGLIEKDDTDQIDKEPSGKDESKTDHGDHHGQTEEIVPLTDFEPPPVLDEANDVDHDVAEPETFVDNEKVTHEQGFEGGQGVAAAPIFDVEADEANEVVPEVSDQVQLVDETKDDMDENGWDDFDEEGADEVLPEVGDQEQLADEMVDDVDENGWDDFEEQDVSVASAPNGPAEGVSDLAPENGIVTADAPVSPVVPPGWVALVDPSSGETYYLNEAENVTTWDPPTGAVVQPDERTKEQPNVTVDGTMGDLDDDGWSDFGEQEDQAPSVSTDASRDHGVEQISPLDSGTLPPLPAGWEELIDPTSGDPYYFNESENLTTWDRPTNAEGATDSIRPANAIGPVSDAEVVETESMTETDYGASDELDNPVGTVADPNDSRSRDQQDDIPLSHEQASLPPLPIGWVELIDESSGDPYYFNEDQNVTTWDRPVEVADTAGSKTAEESHQESTEESVEANEKAVYSEDAPEFEEEAALDDSANVDDGGWSDFDGQVDEGSTHADLASKEEGEEAKCQKTRDGVADDHAVESTASSEASHDWVHATDPSVEKSDDNASPSLPTAETTLSERTQEGENDEVGGEDTTEVLDQTATAEISEGTDEGVWDDFEIEEEAVPSEMCFLVNKDDSTYVEKVETKETLIEDDGPSIVPDDGVIDASEGLLKSGEDAKQLEDQREVIGSDTTDDDDGDIFLEAFEHEEDVVEHEAVTLVNEREESTYSDFDDPIERQPSTAETLARDIDDEADAGGAGDDTLDEAPSVSLPPGWVQMVDPDSGTQYFYNQVDNVTTWEPPTQGLGDEVEPDSGVTKDSPTAEFSSNPEEPETEGTKTSGSKEPVDSLARTCEDPSVGGAYDSKKEADEDTRADLPSETPIPSLPHGWEQLLDPTSGEPYYYNESENVTSWEPPEGGSNVSADVRDDGEQNSTSELIPLGEKQEYVSNELQEAGDEGWSDIEDVDEVELTESRKAHAEESTDNTGDEAGDTSSPAENAPDLADVDVGPIETASPSDGDIEAEDAVGEDGGHDDEEGWSDFEDTVDDNLEKEDESLGGADAEDNAGSKKSAASKEDAVMELPHGWVQMTDQNSGRPYYVNVSENRTTWERPGGETGESAPSPPLPSGWRELLDTASGRPYYLNEADNSTTWERPVVDEATDATGADERGAEDIAASEETAVGDDGDPIPTEDDGPKVEPVENEEQPLDGEVDETTEHDEDGWSDCEEFEQDLPEKAEETVGGVETTTSVAETEQSKDDQAADSTIRDGAETTEKGRAAVAQKLLPMDIDKIEKDADSRALTPFSPRFEFLSSVPKELHKLQEQSARRRDEFHSQIHDLECRLASATAKLAEETMDRDVVTKDWMDRSVFHPIEKVADRVFVRMEKELSPRQQPPSSSTPSSSEVKPSIEDVGRRMLKLHNDVTRHCHVTLFDAKSAHLESLHPVIHHDLASSIRIEHSKAAKQEGTNVRRFESIAGTMSRQYQETRADRRVVIEMMQKQMEDAVKQDDLQGEELLSTLQDLRRRLREERAERKKQRKLLNDRIVQSRAAIRRAMLEAVGDTGMS